MAAALCSSTQYMAGDFVVAAGSILFRHSKSKSGALEVCILYQTRKKEWLLPKGRKDIGETIEHAAVRETFEETGYACELWPQRMRTRATVPGMNVKDSTRIEESVVEPIAVTVRDVGAKGLKLIWWFITLAKDGEKMLGTQMESESFESVFLGVEDAVQRLTFQADRDIVKQAWDVVNGTYTARCKK